MRRPKTYCTTITRIADVYIVDPLDYNELCSLFTPLAQGNGHYIVNGEHFLETVAGISQNDNIYPEWEAVWYIISNLAKHLKHIKFKGDIWFNN